MATTDLVFEVEGSSAELVLSSYRLVIAGYTGRDETAVREHIDELAAIGVPAPVSVPMFYELDPALATTDPVITVAGNNTSGEVEPVLIRAAGRLYLGVGSDHTDRDIERSSVADSKAACPKPIGRTLLPLSASFDWDAVAAQSEVDGRLYQSGTLQSLRIPTDVLALLEGGGSTGGDLVLFGGTISVIGGDFRPGSAWRLSLQAVGATPLQLNYRVVVDADTDADAGDQITIEEGLL